MMRLGDKIVGEVERDNAVEWIYVVDYDDVGVDDEAAEVDIDGNLLADGATRVSFE